MRRPAFTLVELMVSIALVLLLMLGVTRVFSTTQAVVSSNQAISNATRDARGAQSVLAQDFNAFAADSPAMILHSEYRPAFRNLADMQGDRDYSAAGAQQARDDAVRSQDLDGDNAESPAEAAPVPLLGKRTHRIDSLSYFVRGLFKRQTGGTVASAGSSPFLAPMTASEAWVWYGHMRVANDAGSFTINQDPGAGTFAVNANGNNFFATQWVLGRELVLLKEKNSGGQIVDNAGQAQIFVDQVGANGTSLTPLMYGSPSTMGTFPIERSRFDLAATSIGGYRQRLNQWIADNPVGPNSQWWTALFGSAVHRFGASPILTTPLTPAIVSQQAPIFMRGVTSFAVEYAGDYLAQNQDPVSPTYGRVTGVYKPKSATTQPITDGQIDFIAIPPPAGSPPNTPASRRVRWYGAPRNANGTSNPVTGQLTIPGYQPAMNDANLLTEVVPLRDVWRTLPDEAPTIDGAPFERNVNTEMPLAVDYMSAVTPANFYDVAWGPNDPKPKLIRIVFTIDDPLGRTPEGQTFEYVFEVP
jgi:prepilin-type N-terminal cleavage/methylation domain-containing protein